ncbi:MAG TPA: hypothetical protein VGK31_12395 [Thermoanaerobaculia bacterium]
MKRAFILLFLVSTPLFALDRTRRTIVDDVIRMSQAGVSEDAIIAFVVHTRDDFEVTADDVIAMTNAHVSKEVIKAMVDEADARKNRRRREVDRDDDDFFFPYFNPYYDPWWFMPRYYTTTAKARIASWSPPAASSRSSVRSPRR